MSKFETSTLKAFSQDFSEEDMKMRNALLVLLDMLSELQINTCQEIEALLNKQGVYRHEIKHNHNQIKALAKKNYRYILGQKYDEFMEKWCADYEKLEEIVWGAIKKEWGIK